MEKEANKLYIMRGTTPKVVVTIPETIDMTDITTCVITIAQKYYGIAINKTLNDVERDLVNRQFSFFLTEIETLSLMENIPALIQLKFSDIENLVLASFAVTADVGPILHEHPIALDDPMGPGYGEIEGTGVEIPSQTLIIDATFDAQQLLNLSTIHADTTAHWDAQPQFVGKRGHLYIYTDYDNIDSVDIPAMKLGDGSAYLIDAPFIAGSGARLQP